MDEGGWSSVWRCSVWSVEAAVGSLRSHGSTVQAKEDLSAAGRQKLAEAGGDDNSCRD